MSRRTLQVRRRRQLGRVTRQEVAAPSTPFPLPHPCPAPPADCVVWPPLQLINFTFVPLQYRVLYVNVANLFWNTFLSLQANKSH